MVLPVPYEATVSYGKGTSQGPSSIIHASAQVELYDEETGGEAYRVGVATLPALDVKGVRPSKLRRVVAPAVDAILADGKWPLILGGEHSITPAIMDAFKGRSVDMTVVQFDAHADLRESYEGEPMSHACAMARVRESYPAVQIGIRNLSIEEAETAKKKGYSIFYADVIRRDNSWMERAMGSITTENVYVTFDLDAFDSSVMPATGTPEPGGMNWWQAMDFLKMLFARKKILGMDIVEFAPIPNYHACDFLAAKLAYKSISYLVNRS